MEDHYWLLPNFQPIPNWLALRFLPLYSIICAVIFIVSTILWYYAGFKEVNIQATCFMIARIFVQQSAPTVNTYTQKILLMLITYMTVHIGYVYSSQLLSILTKPLYAASPQTLEVCTKNNKVTYTL